MKLPSLPTQDEVLALGRNVASGVAPVLGMLGAFSVLTPDQQHLVATSINQIFIGVADIFKGFKEAWIGILGLGFLVTMAMGYWAKLTAKPENRVASVQKDIASGKLTGVAVITADQITEATNSALSDSPNAISRSKP